MTVLLNSDTEEHELFVPGRICLFGEHSDWAGMFRSQNEDIGFGMCLIAGTNQGLFAKVSAHPDRLVLRSTLDHGEYAELELALEDADLLGEATSNSLFSYIAGVAYQIRKVYPAVGGIVLNNYQTTLPVKKGLSSSAAICVLTARAYSQCYDLQFTKRQEMEFAYLGETTTPSKCGRMDQGCAYGAGQPILMEFRGNELEVVDVVIGGPIHLILVDLAASKNTPAILRDLQQAYPFPTTDVHRGVHRLLGAINHNIMARALEVLQDGNARGVGELMTFAQDQFDMYAMPASPANLTSPVLHKVLSYPALKALVYGGKGVGSQGDGSAQLVARSLEDQRKAIEILESDLGMHCLPLTLGGV
jgi:galactokinase